MIEFGDKVFDRITKFEGIVTAKIEYINGCVRFAVQAEKTKDGKVPEAEFVDEQQLEIKTKKKKAKIKSTGGSGEVPRKEIYPV